MFGARLIQVIETELELRGDGKKTVMRRITQYWSTDGQFLAEVDPYPNGTDKIDDIVKARKTRDG